MVITVMRLNRFGYLIREGFRGIATHGFMSFASVTIIMACLIIMGSVSLLSVNINALIADLENQNEMVAFVDETIVDEAEAEAIAGDIMNVPNVSSVEFVSRTSAMESFMGKYDESMREGIDESVFRHRFVIHLSDIAQMSQSKKDLENVPGIAKVNAHLEYAQTFVTVRNVVTIVSVVLIVILLFVSMFIMTNTIKLASYSRREEIGIMKMVGATNGFIRLPFIVEGLILGTLGGGLAFLAMWGIYHLITSNLMTSITGSFISLVPFESVAMPVFVVYMGLSVFVGTFGGVSAIKNYLKV